MTKQNIISALAVTTGAFALFATGCLGSDENMNSQIYNDSPDGPVTGVGGGNGGGMGGSGALGSIVGLPLATYDSALEGFGFSTYDEPTNLAIHYKDAPPTIDFDADVGSPAPGSLKVFAPYSGANQYVDIQSKAFAATDLRDWKGGKLHVRLRIDSGSMFNGQVEPYVDTTSTFAFVGTSLNPRQTNDWQDFVVDLDRAMTQISGYDLTKVVLFGVHIGSGGGGASQKAVTFHIDSFSIEGIAAPPMDAAAEAATAMDAGTDAPATD